MEHNRSVSRFFFAYALLMPNLFSFNRFSLLSWTGINFLLTGFPGGRGEAFNEPALVGPSDFCKQEVKEMEKKALTWNELVGIYDKITGGHARTKPMETIFDWAERQTEMFFVDEEGYIYLR